MTSTFRSECDKTIGPMPYHFSARVLVDAYDDTTISLTVNRSPYEQGIALVVKVHDPAAAGFQYTAEDTLLVTEILSAGLADEVPSVKQLLTNLSVFLECSGPNVISVPDAACHIVAVLGPTDLTDESNEWMAADFSLLYHAFGGVACSETWLTGRDLHRHVAHDELRGSRRPRRAIMNTNTHRFYAVVPDPFTAFDKALRQAVDRATGDERIIVVICAHGEISTGSVTLGDKHFTTHRMKGILCQAAVPVTILSTACVSGLWAIPYTSRTEGSTFAHSLPSDCFGGYAQTPVSTPGTRAELNDHQSRTLPATCRAEKVIDLSAFATMTAARPTSEKFNEFADLVRSRVHASGDPALTLRLPQIDQQSVTTISGSRDEIALLYRLFALQELPLRANYTTVPLDVQQVTVAGGLGAAALKRVDEYWKQYHVPLNKDMVEPRNMVIFLLERKLREKRLDHQGIKNLLLRINTRIELDAGANALGHYIACRGDGSRSRQDHSIMDWHPEEYVSNTMAPLAFFFLEVQSVLSPGWDVALNCKASVTYERPACFLASTAYYHGFKTVAQVKALVWQFYNPASLSLSGPESLPNIVLADDERLDNLTRSLSVATLV